MPDSGEKTTAEERFLLALLEDGEPWAAHTRGIYEGIKAGHITVDKTGRFISMTPSGREYVESSPNLMNEVFEMAQRAGKGSRA